MSIRILREFIRENLGLMFGLDRHVSMNALADTISGPHPVDALNTTSEPVTSYDMFRSAAAETPSAIDYLNNLNDLNIGDDSEDEVDP